MRIATEVETVAFGFDCRSSNNVQNWELATLAVSSIVLQKTPAMLWRLRGTEP